MRDFIDKTEYRHLLKYIKQFYDYYMLFDKTDPDSSKHITISEFVAQADTLQLWGIDMTVPEMHWHELDPSHQNPILFEEFCHYMIRKHL